MSSKWYIVVAVAICTTFFTDLALSFGVVLYHKVTKEKTVEAEPQYYIMGSDVYLSFHEKKESMIALEIQSVFPRESFTVLNGFSVIVENEDKTLPAPVEASIKGSVLTVRPLHNGKCNVIVSHPFSDVPFKIPVLVNFDPVNLSYKYSLISDEDIKVPVRSVYDNRSSTFIEFYDFVNLSEYVHPLLFDEEGKPLNYRIQGKELIVLDLIDTAILRLGDKQVSIRNKEGNIKWMN